MTKMTNETLLFLGTGKVFHGVQVKGSVIYAWKSLCRVGKRFIIYFAAYTRVGIEVLLGQSTCIFTTDDFMTISVVKMKGMASIELA